MKGILEIAAYNKDLEKAGMTPDELMKFITKVVVTSVSEAIRGTVSAGFNPDDVSNTDPPPLKVRTPKEWN